MLSLAPQSGQLSDEFFSLSSLLCVLVLNVSWLCVHLYAVCGPPGS